MLSQITLLNCRKIMFPNKLKDNDIFTVGEQDFRFNYNQVLDECNKRVLAKVEGPLDFKCTESAVAEVFEVVKGFGCAEE